VSEEDNITKFTGATPPSDEGEGSKVCPFVSTMVLATMIETKSALAMAASGPPQIGQAPKHLFSACVQGDCELWNAQRKGCSISVIAASLLSKVPEVVGESE
jgi:hypothetical protein